MPRPARPRQPSRAPPGPQSRLPERSAARARHPRQAAAAALWHVCYGGGVPREKIVHFRVGPRTARRIEELRRERHVNVSAWLRRLLEEGLRRDFPEAPRTRDRKPLRRLRRLFGAGAPKAGR